MTFVVIVMMTDVGAAQLPTAGVNVYVVVPSAAVVMTAGFQVPFTPSFDVAGNIGAVAF